MTCKRIEKCANGEFCNYHVGFLVSGCMNFKEKKEQTNEEWFCNLSTEEKAKWLGQIAKNAYKCCENGKTNKCVNRNHCTGYCDYGWDEWLKQPHTNEVEK